MTTVLLVVHLMVVIALVGVVLLQRSEGGALGIGGGGGGGFMTSRGTANILTRATGILAAAFFLTSIALTLLPRYFGGPASILDTVPGAAAPAGGIGAPIGSGAGGVLDELNRMSPGAQQPAAPAPGAQVPATPAPAETMAPAEAPASGTTTPAQ
jgi:preprotein translocase subunit SecG